MIPYPIRKGYQITTDEEYLQLTLGRLVITEMLGREGREEGEAVRAILAQVFSALSMSEFGYTSPQMKEKK